MISFVPKKNTRGQLALGLAFGFTMILALFAFVFNTSMNVREKIKLQQTTDFAALVASNTQKIYLNQLREANLSIEAAWFLTLARQQINHCANPLLVGPAPLSDPSGTPYGEVVARVSSYLAINNISTDDLPALEDDGSVNAEGGDPCDTICDQYNSSINKKFRQNYATARDSTKNVMVQTIMNANQVANQYALHHYLQPSNMPWGLQQKLQNVLGEGFTTADAISAYENQNLSTSLNNYAWGYDIVDENKDDPLYIPKSEIRPFPIPNFVYSTSVDEGTASTYQTTCVSTGGRSYNVTNFKNSNVKIVKDGIYETHFFTGINYLPPANMFEDNEALTKRQINTENFGNTETRLGDNSLFQRQIGMSTRAAAKPFGGTFPQSILTDLTSLATSLISGNGSAEAPSEYNESVGKKFEGAKLFGIADEEEIGGTDIPRANVETEILDEQGNVQESWNILRKDYLH